MFGFFLGAACMFGIATVMRHRHGHCCGSFRDEHGHRRRFGRRSWRGGYRGHDAYRGRSWAANRMVDWVASRLDATPDQHRVIHDELDQFFGKTAELKHELGLSRADISAAMRGDSFDAEAMGEAFSRQDDRIREIRETLVGALARVHDALDERQRERLAGLMEDLGRRR